MPSLRSHTQWQYRAETVCKHLCHSHYNAIRMRETPFFANHNGSSAETGFTNNFYAAFTRRFACRANTGPANHNGTSAQTHFANILPAAFTMRLRTGKNQYYGNHNGSSAQTQCAHILAAAITMRFAACHNHCFANQNGSNAQNRRGPSGDNARRSPFWRLWVLRLPLQRARGAQRRQRGPQPLLEALGTAPATAESEGGPAATTRAAAWRLWVLRLPLQRERGAQRRQRAPQPLLQSLDDRLWECE